MRRVPLVALLAVVSCGGPPPDADQLRFRRAYDLTVAGKEGEAVELYRAMLRPDAGSRYQPEAHVALAELAFKQGAFRTALEHYRAVEAIPRAPTRPYAIYKQGWCWLNLGDADKARAAFERAVALEHDESIPEVQRRGMVEAARDGLVKAFARADPPPDDAAAYFQKTTGAAAPRLLDELAQTYAEQKKWERSAALSRELIAAHLDSPRLCEWQANIVQAALATGTRQEQQAEVQRLGAVLARLEAKPPAPEAVQACRARLRDTTRELVLLWHKQGQETKDPSLMELADPLYRQYLNRFGTEKDSYDMTFFHGDVLWQLGRWTEAYEEYRRVVEMNPRGHKTKEAAYASVLAAKHAAEGEPAAPANGKPGALSAGDRRLLDAFALYVAHVPSSAELPAIEYRWARLLYERDHLEEALPLFRRLVERHPDSELAVYAANLELDCLNVLGRTQELCARAGALLAGPVVARDPEAQRQFRKVIADCDKGAPPKTK